MNRPIVLFDGVCNYCNSLVNFLIRQDKKRVLRFAPLQSSAGSAMIHHFRIDTKNTDSMIFIENGKAFLKSSAALKVYSKLPWYWKWTQVFWIVPKFIRDAVYDLFASNRYTLFGKKDQCMIPTPDVASRFLQ